MTPSTGRGRWSTNLMFGSNSDLWRMRYAADRRTIVEWRNPYADPIHNWRYDTGFFRTFGEPECQLMAVEYQEYAQRPLHSGADAVHGVGPGQPTRGCPRPGSRPAM